MLAHPAAFDLVAVTTVCGDTRLRARIAARLLGLAGRTHVDVCAGERAPLLRPESRFVWFGHEGDPLPEGPDARLPDESAPERIVRAAHEHPGLELVAVGPLTNVARAVALDPKLPQRVAGLTVMGGHVRSVRLGTKELPHGIDYNLCSDPEATVAVLGAGFRTTLVTADVTLQTWMGPADLARIEAGGPVARAIGAMLRTWTGVQKKLFSSWGGPEPSEFVAFLHDPLTVQALVDASPLRFETLRIVPTIERGVLRTIEVPAGAGLGAGLGAEMQVATGVDALAARDVIVGGLASL
ncbi:MAG: nucleoside hydrolase [Myxococcota bacterium]|nr:nucleoside hydrolase [Myxococcota bacterium]